MTWNPSEPKRVTACTPLDSRGPKRLWGETRSWVTRVNGDARRVTREYECPVHGRHEVLVSFPDIPDEVPCAARLTALESVALYESTGEIGKVCGHTSPWVPSIFGVWAAPGEVTT